jgi:hypothetical protein
VAGTDLVRQASDELYSLDPDEFIERRRSLADEARRAAEPVAAKQIAALRKPTRSAWTLNALARAEPDLVEQVIALGDQLRDAERRLDGQQLRELSKQRRQLINTVSRTAFAASKQPSPSAALRDEVINTLSAVFADPELADLFRSGTMLRAAQWDGFGSRIRPDLTLVPTPAPARAPAKSARKTGTRVAGTAAPAKRAARAPEPTAAETRAAQRALDQERRARRREQISAANREVAAARRELADAESAERNRRERLRDLKSQVAAMQHDLDAARLRAGRAKAALRKAEQALERAER